MASERLREFYAARVSEFGAGYRAMWGDDNPWKADVRFAPLLTTPLSVGDVVVDVGCGVGLLADFLARNAPGVQCVGVEVVPEFAAEARRGRCVDVVQMDGFAAAHALPPADWYVTFGTLNKAWCIDALVGGSAEEKIGNYLRALFLRARKGVACTMVTDLVDERRDGVCNISPAWASQIAASLSPHFVLYHGYPFYEFFLAMWRGSR